MTEEEEEEVLDRLFPNCPKYLGEVDVTEEFANSTPTDWALDFIESYGQTDGSHHKQWVIDQVVRILLGTPVVVKRARWDNGHQALRVSTGEPSARYLEWVRRYKEGEDGPDTYGYEEGVSP